jgi:2-methylcitrate dehydratase PrpD
VQVTRQLASYLVEAQPGAIPQDVRHEALRALLNIVGCALGGSCEPVVEIALRALGPYFGAPRSQPLGRRERMDALHAALLNGLSSHVHDFDDTTPKNYIHPTSPVASALFAYAAERPVAGAQFLHAFILGFEACSRVGNSVYPAHYDAGWHITGTAGTFGAAAAIGRLEKLDVQRMVWALGLAGTQAAGVREMFGSMGKAFHPGRAAQNGYGAALLAREGFTSGEQGIEGPRGFAPVQAARYDFSKITEGLGTGFDLRANTYKPFPCGIVIHPTIDGCIQLRREGRIVPGDIAAVRLEVAPLVLDLCNKKAISKGLEGKFSIYHAAAIGLVRGKAGLGEFTDETVNDPDVRRVGECVTATANPAVAEDAAHIEVELAGGERLRKRVEHALGNLARPMTDRELEEKFRDQAARVLPAARVESLIGLCWKIGELHDLRKLIEGTLPDA